MAEKPENLVEVVVIGKGLNLHQFLRLTQRQFNGVFTHRDKQYYIRASRLFQQPTLIKDFFSGIKQRFMIVFTQDNAEAIGLEQVATVSGEPITSRILEVVRSSTALGSAFKDMFAKVFGGKKIVFIAILCIVVVVVVLVFSGQLKIKL